MRELFVEKVIDTTGGFLDNNQRIKLKEILTEICLNYHIEVLEQNQKQEIQKNNEDIFCLCTQYLFNEFQGNSSLCRWRSINSC